MTDDPTESNPAARHPVRVGLKLSRGAPIDTYRRVWQIADEGGFDHCWAFDHLELAGEGDRPGPVVFEGWSLLAAMAEATRRVRIGLIVSGLAYRHPALLAKQAVTVDHLSGGRLEFGVGAGWAAFEHDTFGIGTLDHSVGRLDEGLQVIEHLWTQERTSFDGRYFRLHDATMTPKPVQRPRPPVWIGAGGPQVLRVAARRADVWIPSGDGLDAAVAAGRALIALCGEIDRDPAEIRWCAQVAFDGEDPAAATEELRRWFDAGFTELVIYLSGDAPERAAGVAAEQLLPAIRRLG
jgi:probable F420-dependent oxidoreductase